MPWRYVESSIKTPPTSNAKKSGASPPSPVAALATAPAIAVNAPMRNLPALATIASSAALVTKRRSTAGLGHRFLARRVYQVQHRAVLQEIDRCDLYVD